MRCQPPRPGSRVSTASHVPNRDCNAFAGDSKIAFWPCLDQSGRNLTREAREESGINSALSSNPGRRVGSGVGTLFASLIVP